MSPSPLVQLYWREAQFSPLVEGPEPAKPAAPDPAAPGTAAPDLTPLQTFALLQIEAGLQSLKQEMEAYRGSIKDEMLKKCCRLLLHYLQLASKTRAALGNEPSHDASAASESLDRCMGECLEELALMLGYYAAKARLDVRLVRALECILSSSTDVFISAADAKVGPVVNGLARCAAPHSPPTLRSM